MLVAGGFSMVERYHSGFNLSGSSLNTSYRLMGCSGHNLENLKSQRLRYLRSCFSGVQQSGIL